MANKGPRLPDIETVKSMIKSGHTDSLTPIRAACKRFLRINDEQLALQRYKWYNLFPELSGELIERILYYRGQGMLFYIRALEKFYFLPYCLDGTIDVYGRYTKVKPIPFMGKSDAGSSDDPKYAIDILIGSQSRIPVYDLQDMSISIDEFLDTRCILLHDYCKQLSQTVLPRQEINEVLIEIESNILPYVNTLLSNSTGVAGLRVNDSDEQASVEDASQTAQLAALNAKRWIAIQGTLNFQDLSIPSGVRAEDMLMAMQSIDNIRLGTYGLDNGGIFEKKAHLLNAEAEMNTGGSSLVMEDGLYQRQRFCDLVNNYLLIPLGFATEALMDCQISEAAAGADRDFDGIIGNEGNTDGNAPPNVGIEGDQSDGD